ncbi:hypothetical protein [Bordetella genomosp. 5]|uniref:hypothetical protein n=1 Tax=Bordetella genomosp. 5 TaxID=1395608 RepID=UPI0011402ADC|nr:hypothetical protein [Bordetella genomosp. 5]
MSNRVHDNNPFDHPHRSINNTYPVPPIPVGAGYRTEYPVLDTICILLTNSENYGFAWHAYYTSADAKTQRCIKIAEGDEVLLDVKSVHSGADARECVHVVKQNRVSVKISLDLHTGELVTEEKIDGFVTSDQWNSIKTLGSVPLLSRHAGDQKDLTALAMLDGNPACYFPDLGAVRFSGMGWYDEIIGMTIVQNNMSQDIVLLLRHDRHTLDLPATKLAMNLPTPVISTLMLVSVDIGTFMNHETLDQSQFSYSVVSDDFVYIPCDSSSDPNVKSLQGMYKGVDLKPVAPSANSPRTGRFVLRYCTWNGSITTTTELWQAQGGLLNRNSRSIPSAGQVELVLLQTTLANLSITPLSYISAPNRYIVCDSWLKPDLYGDKKSQVWITILHAADDNSLQTESVVAINYFQPGALFLSYTAIPFSSKSADMEVGGVNFLATSYLNPEEAGKWQQGQNIRRATIPIEVHGPAGVATVAFKWPTYELDWLTFPIWIDSNTDSYDSSLGIMAGMAYIFGADLSGNCFYIGTPTLIESTQAKQIMAVYQTPPFEHSLTSGQPMLTLGSTATTVNGLSATEHKNWSVTAEESFKAGSGILEVSAHASFAYGEDFSQVSGSSSSTDLHVSVGVSQNDAVHGLLQPYYYWEYPIFKGVNGVKTYAGVLTVVFPIGQAQDAYFPTTIKDFAYDSDYEIGSILTYLEASKPGYTSPKTLMFDLEDIPVTDDTAAGTSTHYTNQNSTHKDKTYSTNTTFSVGGSLTIGWFTTTVNYHNSDTEASTTSVTTSSSFSISISTGAVKDAIYEYQLTPYIYKSSQTKIMHVKYDVQLTGPGWQEYFGVPKVVLFRVYPLSNDLFFNAFSRSIRFTPSKTTKGNADITVMMFNNSLYSAKTVVCELYLVKPRLTGSAQGQVLILDPKKKVATQELEAMAPIERASVVFPDMSLGTVSYVSVKIYNDDDPDSARIYWGIFPYERFGDLPETLALP